MFSYLRSLLAVIFLVVAFQNLQAQVVSNFSSGNNDGWTIFNLSTGASAGAAVYNAGGYITDGGIVSAAILCAEAPAKFLGNFGSSYKQNLTFDLKTDFVGTNNTNGDVIVTGTGGTLYYQLQSKPGTSFTSYVVPFNETITGAGTGWHFGSVGGAAPTQTQMKTVLGNITSLRIRTKYTTANTFTVTGSLDNVVLNVQALGTPPTITSFSPASGIPTVASVTIKGNNFGSSASANAVYFGGVKATITSASSTQLVVTVPKGAQNAPIIVENLTSALSASTIKPFLPLFDNNQDFGGRIIRASLAPAAAFDVQLNGTKGTNVVGDIDGDGLNDLVVGEGAGGSSGSKQFSVFRNTSVTGAITTSSFTKVSFTTAQPYTKGFIALADFDVDGKLDVVLSSADNSYAYVSVFRNTSTTGSISFAAPLDFVGYSYSDGPLAAADMDGDGRPEILGVFNNNCASGDRLYIYQNLSSPGNIDFAAYSTFSTVYTCGGNITVGDLDGDLLNDVVVTAGQNSVTVFKNTSIPGKLTMAAAFQLSTTSTGNAIIADLDRDGLADLAWPYSNSQNIIIRKNIYSGGTFDATSFNSDVAITSPAGVALAELTSGDFNGDGKIDLVLAASSDMAIFENVSTTGSINSQSFVAGVPFFVNSGTSYPYTPLLADFDGDNKQDIVIRLSNIGNVGAILVYGNESFKAPQITSATSPVAVGGQINVTGNYLNTGGATVQARISGLKASSITNSNSSVAVTIPTGAISGSVSLTEHGLTTKSKLIKIPFGTTQVINSSSFGPGVDFTLANGLRDALDVADFDDDGKMDVVSIDNSNTLKIFKNASTANQPITTSSLSLEATTYTSGYNAVALDIDGDGKIDLNNGYGLLKSTSTPGSISFLSGPNGVYTYAGGFTAVAPADFNKDGKVDLALVNNGSNIQIYENDSDKGVFLATGNFYTFGFTPTNLSTGSNSNGVVAADFDGDGYDDLISTNLAGSMSFYLNTKLYGGISASAFSFLGNYNTSGSQPRGLTANDFDGDGKIDIAVTYFNSAFVSIYRNVSSLGDISFSSPLDITAANKGYNIASQDLDGDGRAEVVVIHQPNPGPGSFSVFQNKSTSGSMSFNAAINYALTRNPQALNIADINSDQKPDILIVGSGGSTAPAVALMVFENKIATVTLSITTQPTDAPVCVGQTGSFTTAATGTTNITYQWQYSPDGIVAYSDISNGSGYSNVTTSTLSVNTTGTFGAGHYRCKVGGDFVSSIFTSDKILTINSLPAAPATTGASSCGGASLSLSASGGTNGQYRWYTVASGGTAITGEVNSSYVTPSLTSTTNYYVSIHNGTCEGTRSLVTASINTTPSAPTVTGASSCVAAALTLTAAGGTNGQYRWYTVATGGTAITGEVNSTYVTPLITSTTNYYISIDNGTCEGPRAAVTAQIISSSTSPTITGASSCGTASVTLTASGGTNGQYRWYTAATGGTAIVGEVNSSYTTPSLTATTNFFVAINNGSCESARAMVTALINTIPAAPTVTGASNCTTAALLLTASGGTNGQYRWYTQATGGIAIAGQTNSAYTTPSLTTTTNYFVSINNGTCESTRTQVTATIGTGCTTNQPPVITETPITTQVEGKVTLDLTKLISDIDNNLDLNTLKVVKPPASGASATIDISHELILDYKGISFSGIEKLTIEVCDMVGACTDRELSVEVAGDVLVYNAVSPNNDGLNDFLIFKYIDVLPETKKNKVTIFGRWGDVVFDINDYDNKTKVFKGLNNHGNEVPSGTYFYRIDFESGHASKTGYITLKR